VQDLLELLSCFKDLFQTDVFSCERRFCFLYLINLLILYSFVPVLRALLLTVLRVSRKIKRGKENLHSISLDFR